MGFALDANSLQGNQFEVTNWDMKIKTIPPVERHKVFERKPELLPAYFHCVVVMGTLSV